VGDVRLATATGCQDQELADSPVIQAAKLQQDVGFASFYRVIATLLFKSTTQGMLSRLGYGRRVYSKGQPLDEAIEYEEDDLFQCILALAGMQMLRRLNVYCSSTSLDSARRRSQY